MGGDLTLDTLSAELSLHVTQHLLKISTRYMQILRTAVLEGVSARGPDHTALRGL